ncbi:MAG: hypothetical protein NC200_02120 [Candidatus Gastranaerophilales bacterium]|nr:hypothetical protein [Candidatus Gastranaerophilales bacterium]
MSIYMQLKYKTKFTDKEILKKALKALKYNFNEEEDEIICNISYYELHLKKNNDGEYEIKTSGYNDWKDEIIAFREELLPIYNGLAQKQKQLQQQICNNIKQKISKNPSMRLEQEEVLEDNSIVLTIKV